MAIGYTPDPPVTAGSALQSSIVDNAFAVVKSEFNGHIGGTLDFHLDTHISTSSLPQTTVVANTSAYNLYQRLDQFAIILANLMDHIGGSAWDVKYAARVSGGYWDLKQIYQNLATQTVNGTATSLVVRDNFAGFAAGYVSVVGLSGLTIPVLVLQAAPGAGASGNLYEGKNSAGTRIHYFDVLGNANFTGSVTASSFIGSINVGGSVAGVLPAVSGGTGNSTGTAAFVPFGGITGTGSINTINGDFKVVSSGSALGITVKGGNFPNFAGGTPIQFGDRSVTLSAAPASPNNRYDAISLDPTGAIIITAGTGAALATTPAFMPFPVGNQSLAQVYVPNTGGVIPAGNITDWRLGGGGGASGGTGGGAPSNLGYITDGDVTGLLPSSKSIQSILNSTSTMGNSLALIKSSSTDATLRDAVGNVISSNIIGSLSTSGGQISMTANKGPIFVSSGGTMRVVSAGITLTSAAGAATTNAGVASAQGFAAGLWTVGLDLNGVGPGMVLTLYAPSATVASNVIQVAQIWFDGTSFTSKFYWLVGVQPNEFAYKPLCISLPFLMNAVSQSTFSGAGVGNVGVYAPMYQSNTVPVPVINQYFPTTMRGWIRLRYSASVTTGVLPAYTGILIGNTYGVAGTGTYSAAGPGVYKYATPLTQVAVGNASTVDDFWSFDGPGDALAAGLWTFAPLLFVSANTNPITLSNLVLEGQFYV